MKTSELTSSSLADSARLEIDHKEAESFATGQTLHGLDADNASTGQADAFLSNGCMEHYTPIDAYEGRHRYDPEFKWTSEEEQKLLDRANIVQALSDNLLDDLNMNTNDYNTGQTIFLLSFLCAELPSQLIGKELPRRLSYFWVSYQTTSIIGAFLATGLLQLRGANGLEGWRWLFAVEGTITGLSKPMPGKDGLENRAKTFTVSLVSFGYLPASPSQTASWFRGKLGWFSVREEYILVNRILRDDPSKGDMHNRQPITPRKIICSFRDWEMWPIYLIGLSFLIPSTPSTNYITLILKSMHRFTTLEISLLTIPAYVLFIINLLLFTWVSERVNQRFLTGLAAQFYMLPVLIALELLPANASPWARWALTTLMVGSPYAHAIIVAITSRNAGSVRTRTVASALYNMFVQASNIIGANEQNSSTFGAIAPIQQIQSQRPTLERDVTDRANHVPSYDERSGKQEA
ncbi:MAG: hypothetical protein Q9227_001545 [Pyrenula ochraceoflavens]